MSKKKGDVRPEECIHLPRPKAVDEHNARHIGRSKDSCGWCCYLAEKERADRLEAENERLRRGLADLDEKLQRGLAELAASTP